MSTTSGPSVVSGTTFPNPELDAVDEGWIPLHAPTTSLFTRFPVFRFDTANSTPRQFLAMSLAARLDLVALVLLLWLVPNATPGQIAIQATAIGSCVIGLWTDTPIITRLLRGDSIDEAWRPHQDHLARNRALGVLAGLGAAVLFVLFN